MRHGERHLHESGCRDVGVEDVVGAGDIEVEGEALLGERGGDGDAQPHGVALFGRQRGGVARHLVGHLRGRDIAHRGAAQQPRGAGDEDVLTRVVGRQFLQEVDVQRPVATVIVAVARAVPSNGFDERIQPFVLLLQLGVDIVFHVGISRLAFVPVADGRGGVVLVVDELHLQRMRAARGEELIGPIDVEARLVGGDVRQVLRLRRHHEVVHGGVVDGLLDGLAALAGHVGDVERIAEVAQHVVVVLILHLLVLVCLTGIDKVGLVVGGRHVSPVGGGVAAVLCLEDDERIVGGTVGVGALIHIGRLAGLDKGEGGVVAAVCRHRWVVLELHLRRLIAVVLLVVVEFEVASRCRILGVGICRKHVLGEAVGCGVVGVVGGVEVIGSHGARGGLVEDVVAQ